MKGRMALIRFLLAGLIAWNLFSAIPSIAQFSVPSASSATGAYKALPSGSTWTDVVAAYKRAASGDTIGLPNGPMIQSTSIWWTKNVSLIGTGPFSKLIQQENLQLFGASDSILIGADNHNPTSNVVF